MFACARCVLSHPLSSGEIHTQPTTPPRVHTYAHTHSHTCSHTLDLLVAIQVAIQARQARLKELFEREALQYEAELNAMGLALTKNYD